MADRIFEAGDSYLFADTGRWNTVTPWIPTHSGDHYASKAHTLDVYSQHGFQSSNNEQISSSVCRRQHLQGLTNHHNLFCDGSVSSVFRPLVRSQSSPYVTEKFPPIPKLNWTGRRQIWTLMRNKESHYVRDPSYLSQHPGLQCRMRSILLDWLQEVCEVYRLHRESYYLTVDYIDRYLTATSNKPKNELQLIGITALFVSSKLEEIYPPKLSEFSYVTDGACSETDIINQELDMVKILKWRLQPVTVHNWIQCYLQIWNFDKATTKKDISQDFLSSAVPSPALTKLCLLLDLATLDTGCLSFQYSVVAAAALYHLSNHEIALLYSGLSWEEIQPCVQWMTPFFLVIKEGTWPESVPSEKSGPDEDTPNIQTHTVDLALFDRVCERKSSTQMVTPPPPCPDSMFSMLTPPDSRKKYNGVLAEWF